MKQLLENVKFQNDLVDVYLDKYPNGTNCLTAKGFDSELGGWVPFATFTINVPDLEEDEVAIKTYSEGVEYLPWLFSWDIIGHPVKVIIGVNNIHIPICKLIKT